MSPDLVPSSQPDAHVRMSDRDREQVVTQLNQAVSEGRLTLTEFEERIDGVLAARTFADVTPYIADLPSAAAQPPAGDATFSARGSSIIRTGRWTVPARLRIEARGSKVRLDFTRARITSPVVHVSIKVHGSGVRLTVPPGSSVEIGSISMHGSSARTARVGTEPVPGHVHFVVTGEAHGSSVRARPPRAWRWPWERRSPLAAAGG